MASRHGRPRLTRAVSNGSLSIRSVHSRRNSIDVAAALPIHYRTVSIEIEDHQKQVSLSKKVKSASADLADLVWHTLAPEEILRRLSSSVEQGLYIIIDNNVYQMDGFVEEHPGGQKILKRVGGKDASKQFWKVRNALAKTITLHHD